MIEDQGPRSRLSGFWACLVGGAFVVSLLVILNPKMRYEDCPNYGANGNASAFENSNWDAYFPLVLLGWVVLVIAEQALPMTWRNRSGADVAVRAASALVLSASSSCCLFLNVATVCH